MNNNNFNGNNLPQTTNGNNPFEIFNYKNLGSVRCYIDQQGTKWFCHKDICNILDIKNPSQTLTRLYTPGVISNEVGVQTGTYPDGTPITQYVRMNFIDEGKLFLLISGSTKREAKKFTIWVSREVLPQLAEKGYYSMNKPMSMPQIVEQIALNVQEMDNRVTELEAWQAEVKQLFEIYGLTGSVSVRGYAIMNNIPINNNQAKFLGAEATKLAKSRGLEIKTIPDPRYGFVNGYPKIILDEVFSTYLPQLRQS